MIRSQTAASRAPAAPPRGRCAPPDPPARSQNPAAIRGQGADSGMPGPGRPRPYQPHIELLRSPTDAGKALIGTELALRAVVLRSSSSARCATLPADVMQATDGSGRDLKASIGDRRQNINRA